MKIHTVGGYSEVGKNMTILEIGEDAIMFDCGLYLPPIVELQERERYMDEKMLRQIGALPDDKSVKIENLKGKLRAILISHAHLDHVGAVPYVAKRYNSDVVGTPFTLEVLKTLIEDEKIFFKNKVKKIQPNSKYIIKGKNKEYVAEFINITHSTLQSSMIAVHTDEGVVLYANDFKFDNFPQLGKKPNYEALKRIAKKGVKALIVESLYAHEERKTASEKIARGLLEDVMLGVDNENSGIVITTFSSHIARLKSIVDMGLKLNRKIVFVGRSLNKYTKAAIKTDLCPFKKDITLASYRKEMEKVLERANKNKKDYLVVCTGHQGEPGSILDRISKSQLPYKLAPNDHVIFSSSVIPAEINIENRAALDNRLKNKKVRIFDKVHVSGHAGREDLRDFINMIKPKHIIPAHGDLAKISKLAELAKETGYTIGKNCHVSKDLGIIEI
jgi:ribonuclease J